MTRGYFIDASGGGRGPAYVCEHMQTQPVPLNNPIIKAFVFFGLGSLGRALLCSRHTAVGRFSSSKSKDGTVIFVKVCSSMFKIAKSCKINKRETVQTPKQIKTRPRSLNQGPASIKWSDQVPTHPETPLTEQKLLYKSTRMQQGIEQEMHLEKKHKTKQYKTHQNTGNPQVLHL